MKIKCAVIEDLLPLYIDEVCSKESSIIVEEHLKECETCRIKLMTQKGNLEVTDEVIRQNLMAKSPFKKIWKHQMISLIIILISLPILYLSAAELSGDGIGFSALLGRYKVERFLSYVERGYFLDATKVLSVSGGIYSQIESEKTAKETWANGMMRLKQEGIEIVSHDKVGITTDDRYTSGYVVISVSYKEELYNFRMFISTNSGKIEPASLNVDIRHQEGEPTETEKMLMNKISHIVTTFNPG